MVYINREPFHNRLYLEVLRLGKSTVDDHFSISRTKQYGYCNIHYICKGEGILSCAGRQYNLKEGSLMLLGPHREHCYQTKPGSSMELIYVEFAGSNSGALIPYLCDVLSPVLRDDGEKSLFYRMQMLYDYTDTIPFPQKDASVCLYELLLELASKAEIRQKDISFLPAYSAISGVVDYIHTHLNQPLGIGELASAAGYSEGHFSRCFKQITGYLPHKFIRLARIEKARELLSISELSVEEISEKCGFSSPSHFIKQFKEQEGATPKQFRKQKYVYTMG